MKSPITPFHSTPFQHDDSNYLPAKSTNPPPPRPTRLLRLFTVPNFLLLHHINLHSLPNRPPKSLPRIPEQRRNRRPRRGHSPPTSLSEPFPSVVVRQSADDRIMSVPLMLPWEKSLLN